MFSILLFVVAHGLPCRQRSIVKFLDKIDVSELILFSASAYNILKFKAFTFSPNGHHFG